MIIVFHDRKKVIKIIDYANNQELEYDGKSIQKTLNQLAHEGDETFIGWCNHQLENEIDHDSLKKIFHHDLIMASYSTSGKYSISSAIGYVEDSTYLNVKYNVTYPTWLMSSDIGAMSKAVLRQFTDLPEQKMSFDLFLNHLAKQALKKGLFCYSEPKLLVDGFSKLDVPDQEGLFDLIKSHYRLRWIFILFFNYLVYEKRLKLWSLFKSFVKSRLSKDSIDFSNIKVKSKKANDDVDTTYDVLIPTLGRAEVLKDVLLDLTQHTILPNKVIIVEQNALPNSKTELSYIYDQDWPFEIDHTFTHQLGACNARNMALSKIKSSWVFLADDDIRLTNTLIENAFKFIEQYGVSALNMASLRKDEKLTQTFPIQWYAFSTNSSFVKTSVIQDITFGMEHEFGFGEDSDFGMKIRNKGTDIIFYPNSEILHLKAPIGGFRVKIDLPWDNDEVQPKPSPTVLAHRYKHTTKEQLLGYKTILFFKFFNVQGNKNPISYMSKMKKRWKRSMFWAKQLIDKYNPNGV